MYPWRARRVCVRVCSGPHVATVVTRPALRAQIVSYRLPAALYATNDTVQAAFASTALTVAIQVHLPVLPVHEVCRAREQFICSAARPPRRSTADCSAVIMRQSTQLS